MSESDSTRLPPKIPAQTLPSEVTAVLRDSRVVTAVSRRLFIISFGILIFAFLWMGVYYWITRHSTMLEDWLWFITTGIGLVAAVILSTLFYQASNKLPEQISHQLLDLVQNLQSPLTGYETVTRKIVEVCQAAEHYYLAATRMPIIGAISDGPYSQEYQTALTSKILARVRTELVCLENEPLYKFVNTSAPQGFRVEYAETIVREFLEEQLPSYVRQAGTKVELSRSPFMPIQLAIADGNKAILYFSPRRDLTQESEIRGFYTTNRDIISALMVGFFYIQSEARIEFSSFPPDGDGSSKRQERTPTTAAREETTET